MPINGNNIMKAMRELKAPSTAEQIARHLARGTKRKFDVLLQEVIVSLVGGVKFGYIECHNGHYYNIKNTTELFNLLESEDSGQFKRPRPIAETNNPRQRKGRLARKRKHNEISDCECESKLETAKAKIGKIIDELAERVEGKKPSIGPDQKPKPTAEELNEHIDQSRKMTDRIFENKSLHGCDVLQNPVKEPALEVLDINRESTFSALEGRTKFLDGINVDQFCYFSDNIFLNQSNSVATELDVQSEAFDITNKTLYSEPKEITNSIDETNTNNPYYNLTEEVFSSQSHLSIAGGEFYNSVTESKVPLEVHGDDAKNVFLGIALLYKLINDANANILTNQRYITNVEQQPGAELNEQSEAIDLGNKTLHSESEVFGNFTNGETVSQYCTLTDYIITDQCHLTTRSDIDRESVVGLEQQLENPDHITYHHDEIYASVKESEVPLKSRDDNIYKNLFLGVAFLCKLVNDVNDNNLTNQSYIVNVNPQPAAVWNVQSEAIDLGNESLHSGLEVFSNFLNEETEMQNCTLTDDFIANEVHLSTASDIERESIVELADESENCGRINFRLDEFPASVTEYSEVPMENRDNVNKNFFFELTESNVDQFHHLTDESFTYLSHKGNVSPQLTAESDVQLEVSNFDNNSFHLGMDDFSSFINGSNNNQYCTSTDDVSTSQSCFLSSGDEFYNSDAESKSLEIHDSDSNTPFDTLMVLRTFLSDSNDNALITQSDTSIDDLQQVADSGVQELANDNGYKILHLEFEDRNDFLNEIMVNQCENLADNDILNQSHLQPMITAVNREPVTELKEFPDHRDHINDALQSEKESLDNFSNVASDQDSCEIDSESFRLELIIPKKILSAAEGNFQANDNVFKIRSHLSSSNIPDIETGVTLTVHDNDIQTLDLELNIPETFVKETRSAYIISVVDSPETQLNDEKEGSPAKNGEKL
ncbi:uncharacterized protein LOC119668660 [Teleopsis dalmanni]|uniref:uncharacterized protein LOC119668660 n=1 Tax=Teleopsis dalmanni TaxID=139649 RepID=UPI0018CE86DB|nr:uncharacterized protein LOC119668660 [Teleopsis dalmanni]